MHARAWLLGFARRLADAGRTAGPPPSHAAWSMGPAWRTNPAVLQAKATYHDAWIAAQRNAVVAPVSGYVASAAFSWAST